MTRRSARHSASYLFAATLGLATLATGCDETHEEHAPQDVETGNVGLALQLAPGIAIDTVSYAVSGNGFTQSGSVDVRLSSTFTALIGGIPAGTGYVISLSGNDNAGRGIRCLGSATFDIMRGATTAATVQLQCTVPRDTGSVQVTAGVNACPIIDALTVLPMTLQVGGSATLSATARDVDSAPAPLAYTWTAQGGTVAAAGAPSGSFVCTSTGTANVTLSVSDSRCADSISATVICTPAVGELPNVRINEAESSGGTPGDWVELYNAGSSAVDLSGFVLRDNDDTHSYALPAGAQLAAGAFLVLDETLNFDFGLGGADSVRLYTANGTLLDSTSWTSHATTTYARCPDGTGAFGTSAVSTKGAANVCGSALDAGVTSDAGISDASVPGDAATTSDAGALSFLAWPGGPTVTTVDTAGAFASNLSGLTYEAATDTSPGVLWAVQNGPSRLFRMIWNGAAYVADSNSGWSAGKSLLYPSGTGAPDAEGVTRAELSSSVLYVAAERDNNNNGVSRLSVLRYDSAGSGDTLTATHEWNLTGDLPVAGANLGLEAISFLPDSMLTGAHLIDDSTGLPYDPARYPGHGSGLFFVGVEGTGMIYGYALDHQNGGFQRVSAFSSGQAGVMDLTLDRETGYLWAYCDNTCGNRATILEIAASGHFAVTGGVSAPVALGNLNNEGLTLLPQSTCHDGSKDILWADDGATSGFSIRRGSVPCGRFF